MKDSLPDNLARALRAYDSPVAVLTWAGPDVVLVAKVDASDIRGFRMAPVAYRWELGLFPAGPVLCLAMNILDDPARPYGIETLLDVAKSEDLAIARRMTRQDHLTLDFYDFNLTYHFSKRIAHREKQRQELAAMIERALAHLATCERPDWYAARQEFFRSMPR
jgi:hypothetical protein